MKKRKGRINDLVISHVRENIGIYAFVGVLLLTGVIFGAIVVNSLHIEQKQNLFYYVQKYFEQMNVKEIKNENQFFDAYVNHLKYIFIIWLLGISMVGLPIILIIVFLKGIVIGFTVGFFVNQLSIQGFYLAIVSILPQNLFILPLFMVISSIAIGFSLKLIRQLFIKHQYPKIRMELVQYTLIFVIVTLLTMIPTAIEVFISPHLIDQVLKLTM